VIMLTRLNGAPFALNPDLIERADATPDTVITLVDGKHYIVEEPLAEVIARVHAARAAVLAEVAALQGESPSLPHVPAPTTHASHPADDGAADVIPMRRNT
jgi:flagellar protein FlbD